MRLRGVIFDLDGTLADTNPVCVAALQETVQHYTGKGMSEAQVYEHFGPSEEGILRKLLPEHPGAYADHYLAAYERAHRAVRRPFPGVVELLRHLRGAGMRTAIVTGKGAETAAIALEHLQLRPLVERVETGFLEGGRKAELIRRVLEGWEMPAEQAAYVGDAPGDMAAARHAGVAPLGAGWAETSLLRMSGARDGYPVFEHLEELAEWIEAARVT